MTDYPRRDAVRAERARQYAQMRLRTGRPKRGGTPSVAFRLEGNITLERRFGRYLFLIDPRNEGYLPEHKTIIGFHALLDSGSCTVVWIHSELGQIGDDHIVTASDPSANLVWLDTPVVLYDNEYLRPEVADVADDTADLTVDALFESTPI